MASLPYLKKPWSVKEGLMPDHEHKTNEPDQVEEQVAGLGPSSKETAGVKIPGKKAGDNSGDNGYYHREGGSYEISKVYGNDQVADAAITSGYHAEKHKRDTEGKKGKSTFLCGMRFARKPSGSSEANKSPTNGGGSIVPDGKKSQEAGKRASDDSTTSSASVVATGNAGHSQNHGTVAARKGHESEIQRLRELTGTTRLYGDPTQALGSLHSDRRVWASRNLRCTNCTGRCPRCKTACCVYYETTNHSHQQLTKEHFDAWDIVAQINAYMPNGVDNPTSIHCSQCKRNVCPKCAGVCPVEICHDRVCKDCKANPWAKCDWHGAVI